MASQMKDLWPDIEPEAVSTPLSILQEQARNVTRKWKGLLSGKVERQLDLFQISHGVEMYPVKITASPLPRKSKYTNDQLESEGDLIQWLAEVLASEKTKRVIASLLRQSAAEAAS